MVYFVSLVCPIEKELVYRDSGEEEDEEEEDDSSTIEIVAKFDNQFDYECQGSTGFDMGYPLINEYISKRKPGWYLSDSIDVGEIYDCHQPKKFCDLTKCTVKRFKTSYAEQLATNPVVLKKFFGDTKDVFARAEEDPETPEIMRRLILWNVACGEKPTEEEVQTLRDFSESMAVNLLDEGLVEELHKLSPPSIDEDLFLDILFKEIATAMHRVNKKRKRKD